MRTVSLITKAIEAPSAPEYAAVGVRPGRPADRAGACVGVVLPPAPEPGAAELAGSLRRAADAAGVSLLPVRAGRDVAGQLRAVDAVLLGPVADPRPVLEHAARRGVPVVLLDRPHGSGVDRVAVDSVGSTASVVRHLVGLGHERIGMIAGPPGTDTTEDRLLGYRVGLRDAGLPVDRALVVHGADTGEAAALAVGRLLRLAPKPTALVVGSGAMTAGAMRRLDAEGIPVPGGMAVVAFDDCAGADVVHPDLTLVRRPVGAMARQAMKLLVERLREPKAPVRRIVVEPEFVHRTSCGCPSR